MGHYFSFQHKENKAQRVYVTNSQIHRAKKPPSHHSKAGQFQGEGHAINQSMESPLCRTTNACQVLQKLFYAFKPLVAIRSPLRWPQSPWGPPSRRPKVYLMSFICGSSPCGQGSRRCRISRLVAAQGLRRAVSPDSPPFALFCAPTVMMQQCAIIYGWHMLYRGGLTSLKGTLGM